MKPILIIVVLSIALSLKPVHADENVTPVINSAQSIISGLVIAFSKNEIGTIEILGISRSVESPWAITPEMLGKRFDHKLIITNANGRIYREQLLKTLTSLEAQSAKQMGDIRLGLIFYGVNGNRLGALYFNGWGTRGAVDDMPVTFSGDFLKSLQETYCGCFRACQ